ncbi:MAG: hypothetical protein ACREBS_08395 [Nitrososphaerales archaeon]
MSKQKNATRSRPRQERTRAEYLEVRIDMDEKEDFKEAAEILGVAVSAWVRQCLRRDSRRVLEEAGRPVRCLSKHQAVKGKNR